MANVSDLLNQRVQQNILPTAQDDAIAGSIPDGNPFPPAESDSLIVPGMNPWAAPATPAETKQAALTNNSQSKQQTVAAAADSKMASMTPAQALQNAVGARTGLGYDTANQTERDLRDLNPVAFTAKYGKDAGRLLADQASGQQQISQAEAGTRDVSQINDDAGLDILGGLIGSVGGLGSLVTGLVNEAAGTTAAGAVGDALDFLNSEKTPQLQARQRVVEARNALDNRDSTAKFEADGGDFVAGLSRIGRDVVSSVSNASSDSAVLGSGVTNAFGSLLAAGPVGKLAKAATAGRAGTAVAIGGLEGGGAYQQVVNDIMDREHSTLEKESPYYRDLIAQGMTPDEARIHVADRTGVIAAGLTAPAAAVTGRLVSRFEGNPLAGVGGKQALGNVARETVEEAVQGGTSQLAQNFAESKLANENKTLSDGIGRQIGEGALYGMGIAVAAGAPSLAKAGAVTAGGKLLDGFDKLAEGRTEANKAASPIADATILKAATEAQASAPEAATVMREAVEATDATPEQKAEATSYVDRLATANTYDVEADGAPAVVKQHMDGVTNRVEAIQRVAEFVNSADEGSNDQLRAGYYLHQLVSGYADLINSDPEAFQAIPEDHQAKKIVGQYVALMGAISNTPKVMDAIGKIQSALDKRDAAKVEINEATLATPEGQQDVQDAISVSSIAPAKANLETTEQILFHAAQGRIQITPQQKAALDTSVALLRATKAADEEAKRLGQADPVSLNIRSVDGEKGQSVLQHAQGIMSAWKSGDRDLAAGRLTELQNFAQSMANKASGLAAHFAAGNPQAERVSFDAYANGEFYPSKTKLGVVPSNQRSVEFIQKVTSEARLVADVLNGMIDAFPDLGGKHIEVAPLDAQLVGPAKDVAARFKAAAVTPSTATPVKSVEAKVEPAKAAPTKVETVPEVKAEPAPTVVEKASIIEETIEPPKAEPRGTAAVFNKLIGGAKNAFNSVFKIPTEQRSRLLGSENPLDLISKALKNSAAFTALLGSAPKGEYSKETAAAYSDFLNLGQDIAGELDNNLQSFLDGTYSKSIKTTIREVLGGAEVRTGAGNLFDPMRTVQGKTLNLVEEHEGELVYNPELAEGAVLAGLQWLLSAANYGSRLDGKDVAEMTGLQDTEVTEGLVTSLNQGLSVLEAKRSLGQKIRQYWGLQNETNGDIGYQEGIPEAMAAEILRVLKDNGALVENRIKLTEADGVAEPRTFVRLIQPHTLRDPKTDKYGDDPFAAMRPMPDAIERAVLVNPEEVNFIGEGNLPPVATDQLRNPGVKNTAQQLEAIKNEQSTPYYVNPHMAGLYMAMGKDTILRLFGAGSIDRDVMNVNHAKSLEGVNQQTVSAFDHLQGLLAQVQNQGEIDQTPIHYPFNMTRVARLQMLGKFNPQSNKMVREAILPTRSTLDMTDGKNVARFNLGLAQALGVKVHKMSGENSSKKVMAMLDGPLAPAVEALRNWAGSFDKANTVTPLAPLDATTVDTLVDAFKAAGEPLNPVGLHAVMDYARLLNTDDKSAFTTSIYVEADGVTNGPINAMVLFTTGMFSGKWINNIAKGGLFFNRPGETVNSNIEKGDDRDLYQATTDRLKTLLKAQRASFSDNKAADEQLSRLYTLMDMFLDGDLQFVGNVLTLQRGIAKNPLTITIYGSGAGGIASKMTRAITDAIYERMSQVAEAQANGVTSLAEAMFGPQTATPEDAKAMMAKFVEAYSGLVTKRAFLAKGKLLFKSEATPKRDFDPVKFTFDKAELNNMTSNMLHMFVTPMRNAIEDTVGKELTSTATQLRQATQVQSIVMQHAFTAAVDAKLAEKAKDPDHHAGDFLTNKELAEIRKSLDHMAPLIETDTQSFFVAGSQSADVGKREFSRALDGTMSTPAFVDGPMNSGVSGIPFLNIGAGDGQMMQNISTAKDAPTGTLKIFDGMNMPLDQMENGSVVANQAVMDSWMGNPLKAVSDTFAKFLADTDLSKLDGKQLEDLSEALFGLGEKGADADTVRTAMDQLAESLVNSQQSIEARHNVMKMVNLSVDQMAAVAMPFENQGTVELVGTDSDSLAQQLNALYTTELTRIQGNTPTDQLSESMASLAQTDATGVSIISAESLKDLPATLPSSQAAVMAEIVNSLAADGYTIVHGSFEQVAAYNEAHGLPGMTDMPAGEVHGYTNVGSKTVYLFNTTSETLVHELIHAASFEAVNAHYNGETTREVSRAVSNLESLMADFLEMGDSITQGSADMLSSFDSATSAIRNYQADGNKAAALNEFMAWTLSNQSLSRMLQRNQVSKLARMKDAVIAGIKSLLGIKSDAGKDMFSNVLFNSSILMHSQPNLSQRFTAGSLYQSSVYGTDDRLSAINGALVNSIGRYLNETPVAGKLLSEAALSQGIMMSYRISQSFMAHGFPMDMQQASTFNTIVAALATEAKIDPNAMSAAQQLYAHVMKKLDYTHFMADPQSQDPNVETAAREKYDVLVGKYLVEADAKGRSTLLPSFLGLATVHPEFRAVLAKLDLPKNAHNNAGTLDAVLENTGNKLIDSLSKRMAGTTKATNVQEAIDLLNIRIADEVQKRETFIDQMSSTAGGVLDRANDLVVSGMDKLSTALLGSAKRAQANGAGKLKRAATGVGAAVAAFINESVAQAVAEGTMTAVNKSKMWEPLSTLINDLIGRTESNASIYDKIKTVRSTVQKTRQQFRENLPTLLVEKFSRELTDSEWNTLHTAMGKADLAVLRDGMSNKEIFELLSDKTKLDAAVSKLETTVQNGDKGNFKSVQKKAAQLAHFMISGEPGANLLRNAEAVSNLFSEAKQAGFQKKTGTYVSNVDKLITVYALQDLSADHRTALADLASTEADGMGFTLSYLKGQRAEEIGRATSDRARVNMYKGYIPSTNQEGVHMIVADDTEYSNLIGKSYQRVADYTGSTTERGINKGYYFSSVAARPAFEQGIMQNVRQSAGGVDATTGHSLASNAGRITDAVVVKALAARMSRESGTEPLLPVYDASGAVVAFERSLSPTQMAKIGQDQHLAKMIGQWRGRQVEESMSQKLNESLIDNLYDMHEKDLAASADNAKQYVDLANDKVGPVVQDALDLFSPETMAYIETKFGKSFPVRKDMLNDTLGYRSASIGDAWSGNTRWSPETQKTVRNIATSAMGNSAYKTLLNAERIVQSVVSDAKVLIVVKSVIVPVVNLMSNVFQLAARGVPLLNIGKGMTAKTAEVEAYTKSRVRQIEAEAELRAADRPQDQRRLKAEIQSIQDAHKRMSIWPLLEAGEFTGISDAGTREDVKLTSGRLQAYIENAVNKLPAGFDTLGRYALVTKDTALFQGLQKAVEYGDFLAKAVLFDDLTTRKGLTDKQALARVTEEFVNYDRLSGRFRGTLEKLGLLWFYNFKIRSAKVAASMIRNNPVHTLLSTITPTPSMFGTVGLPTEDNIFSKLADGTLDNSMGPGQGLNSIHLNPWINLTQ